MEKVRQAVNYYNTLLAETPNTINDVRDFLYERMKEKKMIFGGRVLSPYVRPHFVSVDQWSYIKDICRVIWRCIEKMGYAIKASDSLQEQLGVTPQERELVMLDSGFTGISVTSRLDSFLTEIHEVCKKF